MFKNWDNGKYLNITIQFYVQFTELNLSSMRRMEMFKCSHSLNADTELVKIHLAA